VFLSSILPYQSNKYLRASMFAKILPFLVSIANVLARDGSGE